MYYLRISFVKKKVLCSNENVYSSVDRKRKGDA
jgi:hypothetical protein